ncbi:MAG: GGDEF domain-containing protein [Spirochaetales bacterium]|jgi:diguanylate cyclase (GGDEF)-like protein|nr:GGDEF domain-containing protein [Spirochaetales bacterium]
MILGIILIDYSFKYNTDHFQRLLFLSVLWLILVPLLMDFIYVLLHGRPGKGINTLLWTTNLLYYLFQAASLYAILLFMDYSTYKNARRTRRFFYFVLAFNVLHFIILIFNFNRGFYYSITETNYFRMGDRHYIRLIIAYSILAAGSIDVLLSDKLFDLKHLRLFLFILIVLAGSATLSYFIDTIIIFWPFIMAGLLYVYFFIIRSDARIDSLTGIANRYSLNEFIETFTRSSSKKTYAFVFFDLDHFKHINDAYGHQEGDNALKDFAQILKKSVRKSDFAARYGGDEFVIAARAKSDVTGLIKRIQDEVQLYNETSGKPYRLEVSCGHDLFTNQDGLSIEDFLNHIDSLMYKNKAERRRALAGEGANR